jgi:tRNA-specific 2-thiouridylase
MEKTEVRALAREFELVVADKDDSQDICFVPSGKYADFIAQVSPAAAVPGEIVHLDGRVLGHHAGVIHYTIGQRRGLGLGGVGAEPLYVVRLDAAAARVIVGPRSALATRIVHLRGLNWLGDGSLADIAADGIELCVRVRSTRAPVPAFLHAAGGTVWVELVSDEDGVSPGQACVFYASADPHARVLGGGFIASTQAATQGLAPRAADPVLATAGH